MATRYEKSLGTVPCLTGCTARELRVLARLVDDVSIPAGGHVRAPRGEVILVASGDAVVLPDHSMFAATALRLVVIGRREMQSLLHTAPDLGTRLLTVLDHRFRGGRTEGLGCGSTISAHSYEHLHPDLRRAGESRGRGG